jgi:hypothetical protein
MEINGLEKLRIKEETGDTIAVYLSEKHTPLACLRKKHELIYGSGMTEEEATHYLETAPVSLELFYDTDRGLFAVEEEACECCEIFNPYTGNEIPNDNLPIKEEKTPRKRLDEILGELEYMQGELREIWETIDFPLLDEERLENARASIDEALAELHSIGETEDEE